MLTNAIDIYCTRPMTKSETSKALLAYAVTMIEPDPEETSKENDEKFGIAAETLLAWCRRVEQRHVEQLQQEARRKVQTCERSVARSMMLR